MYANTRTNNKWLLPVITLSVLVIAVLAAALLLLGQELADTRTLLAYTQGHLVEAETDLRSTQTNLVAAETELTDTQGDLAQVTTALRVASERIASLESALANLHVNYERLTDGYGYVLQDPTYEMVMAFLAEDDTSANPYDVHAYNCTDFSADVKANAAKQGIRCAYVNIYFPDGRGHAIVAFDTTDKGLIFIEPQTDEEANLRVGRRYYDSLIPRPGYHYPEPDYDDTILRYTVIW